MTDKLPQVVIEWKKLRRMLPQQLDKLGSTFDMLGHRKRWVGFGFVDEGKADGTEEVKVVDDD